MAKIEIYTTAICPYCAAAKNFLKAKGLSWDEIRIDALPEKRNEMMARSDNRRTVPQIFINDKHVGGYDDMVAMERAGTLKALLA